MKKLKFVLNPHERKDLRKFLGYLKRNYVAPTSKLHNELEKSDKKFVGSFCFRSFLFWKTFQNDKRRLDYEIKNALLENLLPNDVRKLCTGYFRLAEDQLLGHTRSGQLVRANKSHLIGSSIVKVDEY